jgi:hypothetical protein
MAMLTLELPPQQAQSAFTAKVAGWTTHACLRANENGILAVTTVAYPTHL